MVFFRRGWTTACLKQVGIVPVARELLTIERMLGAAMSKTSFRRAVGTISRGQVADFIEETIFIREGSVMGWKQSKSDEQTSETAMSWVEGEMFILMFSTLLIKN